MLWGEFILCIAFQSPGFASYFHTLGCRIIIWTKSCKSLIHWRTNFINILGPKCFLLGTFGSEIFLVRISCLQNFLSWVLCGSKNFLVGSSWAQKFLLWLLRWPERFYRGYFVGCGYLMGPIFFVVGTSQVRKFYRRYFVGREFFLAGISQVQNFSRGYFVGPKFFLLWIFHGS